MWVKSLSSVGAVLVLVSAPSQAQAQIEAEMTILEPQIRRDDAGFQSCGVRAVVLTNSRRQIESYDFSINAIGDNPLGLLKAGKLSTTHRRVIRGDTDSRIVMPGPLYFWIAQAGDGDNLQPIKTFPADTGGYILEAADWEKSVNIIYAIIHGERMQFAIRYKKQAADYVVSFSAEMAENHRQSLLACLQGITERVRANIKGGLL